jgi:hypothetical protein
MVVSGFGGQLQKPRLLYSLDWTGMQVQYTATPPISLSSRISHSKSDTTLLLLSLRALPAQTPVHRACFALNAILAKRWSMAARRFGNLVSRLQPAVGSTR